MSVENKSGIWPTGYRVLVKPDPIEEKTEGGLFIPETSRKDQFQAQQSGVLVVAGLDAWGDYPKPWAKPGDRVTFARYQGEQMPGKDGEMYRLINDEQVTAVIEPEVELTDYKSRRRHGS